MITANKIYHMDSLAGLKKMQDESVQCCVTSPPYWGLRDYKVKGQMGQEKAPEEFIQNMVGVFSEVKRVLKKDGVLWLNIGDSYCSTAPGSMGDKLHQKGVLAGVSDRRADAAKKYRPITPTGMKPKDLVGIPWMLAFALRSAGWYLRCDIIWAKKNCMPESVTDRPTRSHEYVFLLSKSSKYYYNHEAIKEAAIYDIDGTGTSARKARQREGNKSNPVGNNSGIRFKPIEIDEFGEKNNCRPSLKDAAKMNGKRQDKQRGHSRRHNGFNDRWDKMTHEEQCTGMRNKRDVWSISPAQFPEAHFATFPEEIPDICIMAGSKEGDIILDPFMGAGTTALVARKRNRNFIGFELNPDYIKIAENRLKKELGMFL